MAQSLDGSKLNMEGCVMLALSTFRQSQKAIDVAIEAARKVKKLMIIYVADVNLARYMVEVDHGLIPTLIDICEADLLKKHELAGREHVAAISERAKKEGIEVQTRVTIDRFALACLEVGQQIKPSRIVTTRSRRPEWVRKFYGAPVDDLIEKAGCTVTVV